MQSGNLILTDSGPWLVLWGADEPNVALYPAKDGCHFVEVQVAPA